MLLGRCPFHPEKTSWERVWPLKHNFKYNHTREISENVGTFSINASHVNELNRTSHS